MVSRAGLAGRGRFQRAFRPVRRAGNQIHLQARLLPQAQDGGKVFSWAPPTIRRVMTCVTRIRCGHGAPDFQSLKAVADEFGFGGIGLSIGQVELVVADRGIGVLPLPGNFGQAVVDLESGGKTFCRTRNRARAASSLSARR